MTDSRPGSVNVSLECDVDVAVPVEVRDENLALVQTARAGDQVELPTGTYVVSAVLPTGEKQAEVVKIDPGDELEVLFTPEPGTIETPPPEPLERLGPAERRFEPWFLRFLPPERAPGIRVREASASDAGLTVALDLEARADGVTFAQVARAGEVPVSFALPIAPATLSAVCELRVTSGERLLPAVSLGRVGELHSVAEYLTRGYFEAAAGVVVDAELLLQGKVSDPIGAAVGGYALLRAGTLEPLHDWPGNLSNWFAWLPDGAVIAGEQARRQEDHATALTELEAAAARGLPIFSDGFSILLSRLGEYARSETRTKGVTKPRVRAAETHATDLAALAPFVDYSSLVLSVLGADPLAPQESQQPLDGPSAAQGWRRFRLPKGDSPAQDDYWSEP
jgi:hypothetical protein